MVSVFVVDNVVGLSQLIVTESVKLSAAAMFGKTSKAQIIAAANKYRGFPRIGLGLLGISTY